MEKRRNCSLGAISPLFHNIFYLLLDFHVWAGTRYPLRDKRLFEITRVNCIYMFIFTNHISGMFSRDPYVSFQSVNLYHSLGYQQTTNWSCFSYFSKKICFGISCNLSPKDLKWSCCCKESLMNTLRKQAYSNILKTSVTAKNWKFSDKNIWYFSFFCSKRLTVVIIGQNSRYSHGVFDNLRALWR